MGVLCGGTERGAGSKKKKRLKVICKCIQFYVYLIYVNLHICTYIYAQINWES